MNGAAMRFRFPLCVWQASLLGVLALLGCKSMTNRTASRSEPLLAQIFTPARSENPKATLREPITPIPVAMEQRIPDPEPPTVIEQPSPALVASSSLAPPPASIAARPLDPAPADLSNRTVSTARTVDPEPIERPLRPESTLVASAREETARAVRAAPVGGDFGHSPDYRWIQGRICRPYTGGIKLRFCDVGQDHPWGGNVFLLPDEQTSNLKEGTVVWVQGHLLEDFFKNRQGSKLYSYPTYQVHSITVLREGW
jgi:hypothetical protein